MHCFVDLEALFCHFAIMQPFWAYSKSHHSFGHYIFFANPVVIDQCLDPFSFSYVIFIFLETIHIKNSEVVLNHASVRSLATFRSYVRIAGICATEFQEIFVLSLLSDKITRN